MSTLSKGFISGVLAVSTFVAFSGALLPVAKAQSTADLQAQIAALLAQIQALQSQLGQPSGGSASYTFTRDLTVGATGDDVKELQKFLNSHGFVVSESGAGSPGNESSYFGEKTRAALAKWQAAEGISPTAGYFGPKSRAAVNALASGPGPGSGPGPVVPPSSGLVLALASDNPAGAAVPKGAAGVAFLKFSVSGSGTLNSLTFKRVGIGATADFSASGIYLYEGSTRLTTGRSLNSTSHEVSFLNLNLAISGTRTFWLAADVATAATTGNRHAFQLLSGTGTPNPSGSLSGNEFVVAGQAVGTITATSGAAPTNPKVGQKAAKIAEFKLQAGSTEDVNVLRVSLTEGGSIANSNLSNFVLKQAGNTIATASAIGGKDLITFELTSPFLLEKGQERTFEVWSDVSGSTRSADTIVLYFDSKADIYAVGKTYGFPVDPTITALDATSEGDTLTVQGGDITITFNGPIASDIALRGQDVVLFDFNLASQNNVEIRNLRLHATTTNLGSGEGFNDFKVWDVDANGVVTSATDVTTSSDVTFTDVLNISAGQSKRYRVSADVDSDNDANDTVLVSLLAFQSNDIRNLDNNTYVATSVIVPNSTVVGNTQTVKAPTLDAQLSATPSSQTYAKGSSNQPLVGLSFRAISDSIRLDSVRVTATASSGTLNSGELTSLALYDGSTRISDFKSLDSSALQATFNNLNLTIAKGDTKVLTVRGNIATDATSNDIYYVYLAAADANELTAYDSAGNSATLSGTAANSGASVTLTVVGSGDVTVAKAPDDSESEAGIVIAAREQVLAKFRFTAANEQMTLNKLQLLVVPTNSATATSSASADEVPTVKLYDGSTQIGSSAGYAVTNSGADSGTVFVENLGWVIPKDGSKTLTVRGVLNSISGGADSGASVYTSVMAAGFEAQGSTALDTTVTAATGNEKVAYKTRPTVTVAAGDTTLTNGLRKVMKFTVAADSAEQVAWRKVQLAVTMTSATMSAATANPGTTGTVQIKDVSSGSNLNIATGFSGSTATASTTVTITGGNAGYVTLMLANEEVVSAGSAKEYEVYLTFADVPSGSASAVVNLHRQETSVVAATTFSGAEGGTPFNGNPSFIWSDYSTVGHSQDTSTDWANGVYVKTLPSTSFTVSKT